MFGEMESCFISFIKGACKKKLQGEELEFEKKEIQRVEACELREERALQGRRSNKGRKPRDRAPFGGALFRKKVSEGRRKTIESEGSSPSGEAPEIKKRAAGDKEGCSFTSNHWCHSTITSVCSARCSGNFKAI